MLSERDAADEDQKQRRQRRSFKRCPEFIAVNHRG